MPFLAEAEMGNLKMTVFSNTVCMEPLISFTATASAPFASSSVSPSSRLAIRVDPSKLAVPLPSNLSWTLKQPALRARAAKSSPRTRARSRSLPDACVASAATRAVGMVVPEMCAAVVGPATSMDSASIGSKS